MPPHLAPYHQHQAFPQPGAWPAYPPMAYAPESLYQPPVSAAQPLVYNPPPVSPPPQRERFSYTRYQLELLEKSGDAPG